MYIKVLTDNIKNFVVISIFVRNLKIYLKKYLKFADVITVIKLSGEMSGTYSTKLER